MNQDNIFDVSKLPFSRYGSYLALFEKKKGILSVHWVMKVFNDDTYTIEFLYHGKKVTPEFSMSPICLKAAYRDANAIFYIHSDDSIAIDGEGFDFTIKPKHALLNNCYGTEYGANNFEVISFKKHFFASFKVFQGRGKLSSLKVPVSTTDVTPVDKKSVFKIQQENGHVRLIFHLSDKQLRLSEISMDSERDLNVIEKEWNSFLEKLPNVKEEHREFAECSWYNLWSSVIRKSRFISCDTMLMSKNRMCALWSWDNCFNAMALNETLPELAYKQFTLPYEFQSETGALPDLISYNNEVYYGITKPPVHGWAFEKMRKDHTFSMEQLQYVYEAMSKQTRWWFDYSDADNDGIPDYPHGCDSGADNGTNFLKLGHFVESPDLPAYLFLQMKVLAQLAKELHLEADETQWNIKAEQLLKRFLDHSIENSIFVSKKSHTHEYNKKSESFLHLMPLIIGEYLNKELVETMLQKLKERHLTEYGISSEAYKNKKYYHKDGYWQGPIWAPSTYLFIDALKRIGEKALAKEIVEKYLNMVIYVAKGNYENYDAKTGRGLRAPGYTWTASVTLLLMKELNAGEFE